MNKTKLSGFPLKCIHVISIYEHKWKNKYKGIFNVLLFMKTNNFISSCCRLKISVCLMIILKSQKQGFTPPLSLPPSENNIFVKTTGGQSNLPAFLVLNELNIKHFKCTFQIYCCFSSVNKLTIDCS